MGVGVGVGVGVAVGVGVGPAACIVSHVCSGGTPAVARREDPEIKSTLRIVLPPFAATLAYEGTAKATSTTVDSPGASAGNGTVARRVPGLFVPSYHGLAVTALNVIESAPAAHERGDVFVTRTFAVWLDPSTAVAGGASTSSYFAPQVRELKYRTSVS